MPNNQDNNPRRKVIRVRFNFSWLYLILILGIGWLLLNNSGANPQKIEWAEVQEMFRSGDIKEIDFIRNDFKGNITVRPDRLNKYADKFGGKVPPSSPHFIFLVSDKFDAEKEFGELNAGLPSGEKQVKIVMENDSRMWTSILEWIIFPVLLILMWIWMFRGFNKNMGGGGAGGPGGVFNVGKSTGKLADKEKVNVTFKDVAGLYGAKEEVMEIVDFLKNPQKYTSLGGKIPKGALLVGPPGTGKTLLAKAVAGEANVPFFSISGSDFVEMYVGVGASRVRDLFNEAKKNSPSIIFIDEIDAVGRHRGAGMGGGHDEREQTLNQLLVEMDGFGANEGVIIIAATNRPDILDPALLRPGRFDRQVTVGYPDLKGREAILKVHAKGKPLGPDVDLSTIAKTTIGFTGADLENLLNEAALLAARRDKKAITMTEIEEAMIKVVAGTEKKSHKMTDKEKRLTAYHEAGHAVSAYYLEYNDPVHQVSIVPRGQMGGYTMYLPTEDKSYHSKNEMLDNLVSLLGGRVAEALIIGDVSTGASNDIERATDIARKMVTKYGMSEKLGPITFGSGNDEVFLGRDYSHLKNYSEETAAEIDEEINRIITTAYGRTEDILKEHIDRLHAVAGALIEREKISGEEFETIMHGGTLDPLSAQSDDSKPAEVPEQSDAQNNEEADGNEKESE